MKIIKSSSGSRGRDVYINVGKGNLITAEVFDNGSVGLAFAGIANGNSKKTISAKEGKAFIEYLECCIIGNEDQCEGPSEKRIDIEIEGLKDLIAKLDNIIPQNIPQQVAKSTGTKSRS